MQRNTTKYHDVLHPEPQTTPSHFAESSCRASTDSKGPVQKDMEGFPRVRGLPSLHGTPRTSTLEESLDVLGDLRRPWKSVEALEVLQVLEVLNGSNPFTININR